MRITDAMISSNFVNSLNKSKEQVQNLQNQISLGSKINKPSDSPSGTSRVLKLQDQINSADIYINNIGNSEAQLQTTTAAMESIQNEVQNTVVLFTNARNPINQSNYNSYADQIDLTLKAVMDLANTEYDGKYVFGGTDFSQKPYQYSSTQVINAATGQLTTPVMQNVDTSGKLSVRISTNSTQQINVPGSDLFGVLPNSTATPPAPDAASTDIFNTMVRVRDSFRSGVLPSEADMKIVSQFNQKMVDQISSVGNVINRLDATQQLLEQQQVDLKSLMSKEKDVDVAASVIDLQNQQYFLDLSYKMSSMILPKSLLDYL